MPDREGYYPCSVTRLPLSTTTEQVLDLFSQFGRVLDAMVFVDNFTGESMGKAYVIFEERSARSAAMKMTGRVICGQVIAVTDPQSGFGRNAYECHDSQFDDYFSIGESRRRGPREGHSGDDGRSKYVGNGSGGPGPDRGVNRPREGNTDAGNREGLAKMLRPNDRP